MVLDTLGARIRYARHKAGLTGAEVARRAEVRHATLSELETGSRVDLLASTLLALSRVLDVSPDWLLTGAPGHLPHCGELSPAEARACEAVVSALRSR